MNWLKLLEILWAWPTVVAIALALFHREVRTLLQRIAATSRAKLGSLELEISSDKPGQPSLPLERIEGKEYRTGVVELDGKEFVRCKFEGVTLRFNATMPVSLQSCSFADVRWELAGPAALTLKFLTGLYAGAGEGGKALVEATFTNVRKGVTPLA